MPVSAYGFYYLIDGYALIHQFDGEYPWAPLSLRDVAHTVSSPRCAGETVHEHPAVDTSVPTTLFGSDHFGEMLSRLTVVMVDIRGVSDLAATFRPASVQYVCVDPSLGGARQWQERMEGAFPLKTNSPTMVRGSAEPLRRETAIAEAGGRLRRRVSSVQDDDMPICEQDLRHICNANTLVRARQWVHGYPSYVVENAGKSVGV